MTTILMAKDKFLVKTNTCNYKPYNHLGQMAKNKLWLMDTQVSCWCLVTLEYDKMLRKVVHIIVI
jgi:hypothetical protein